MERVLEINLISAQALKPPSTNLRRMQTYAVVYIDPHTKLRTRIDKVGSENPSWNDKFLFKVTQDFLSRDTSTVSFEIYAVGCLKDSLIGTVRFLINNLPSLNKTPSVTALQVRRPSGRFQGILNIAVVVNDRSLELLDGVAGIGYRDLMGGRMLRKNKKLSVVEEEFSSDGGDSTSSSSKSSSDVLRDWNSVADGGGLLCGLLNQRRYTLCFSDFNTRASNKENR